MGHGEPIDTGSCRLLKSVDSLDWPAMILGAVAVEFEIAEPPELVEPSANWTPVHPCRQQLSGVRLICDIEFAGNDDVRESAE